MITVISQGVESTTDDVLLWLKDKEINFERVNGIDLIESISLDENKLASFKDCNSIRLVWFRRWLSFSEFNKLIMSPPRETPYFEINSYFKKELIGIRKIIFSELLGQGSKFVNGFPKDEPIKIEVLKRAISFGLDTPSFLLTSQKEELRQFKIKHNEIIIKPFSGSLSFTIDQSFYCSYTAEVNEPIFPLLDDQFFPVFCQEKIDKEYEIRSFYLDKKFYSMAIFSQESEQTSVDFRNYNLKKPNRLVPFILPQDLQVKLTNLMNDLGLDTGSIDIIRSKDKRWVFLEVNPEGQFGMVSYPCNYFLEEKFAEYLIRQNKENNAGN